MTELEIAGKEFGCQHSSEMARTLQEVGIGEWKCEQEVAASPDLKTYTEARLICPGRNPDGSCGLKKILASVVSLQSSQEPTD